MEMLKTTFEDYWYHCSFLAWQWESRKSSSGYRDRDDLFSVPKPKEYIIGWRGIHFLSKKAWTVSPTPANQHTWAHICGTSESSWPGQWAHPSLPRRPLPTPGALTFSSENARSFPGLHECGKRRCTLFFKPSAEVIAAIANACWA